VIDTFFKAKTKSQHTESTRSATHGATHGNTLQHGIAGVGIFDGFFCYGNDHNWHNN